MTKIPKHKVVDEIEDSDIWTDDETAWWYDEYREDYWDHIAEGGMSWQWYMKLVQYKNWHSVIINSAHKNMTIDNWLREEYPGVGFYYEKNHFLIERHDVAVMLALKWT